MKNKLLNLCSLVALGGLLVCPASHLQAQITNTYTQTFDAGGNSTPFAGGSTAGWFMWYNFFGNVTMTNDPAMDADGTPGSGSLLVSLPFDTGGGQQVFYGSFDDQYQYDTAQTANAVNFTNITFKVRVQAGTPPDGNGNFGAIGVGLLHDFGNGGEPGTFSYQTIPGAASNGWVTITAPIDKTAAGVDQVGGFFFNYNNFGGFPHAPIVFWMDDVSLNLGGPPPPPPTLSVSKPVQGLNVYGGSGGINDRESVMSTSLTGDSWVGAGGPVTYSFTIASYPDSATYPGFASYMFLIPGPFTAQGNQTGAYADIPSFETAPDYNETNVLFLDIENQNYNVTNGVVVTTIHGAVAQLRYKVNEPAGNNMIYGNPPYTNAAGSGSANFGSGTLGSVSCPTAVGTWSLTFNGNTSATVTGPDGTHATFTIPSADAAAFSGASGFVFLMGTQPNSTGNIGQAAVFSNVSVTGVGSPIADNFLGDSTLDTNKWAKLAADASGVFVVPSGSAYLVSWTLPDAGFSLQNSASLTTAWTDAGLPVVGPIAGTHKTVIPTGSLPGNTTGFYRLVHRTFSQLQVLLPGETNAPDTVTGKTGTPTAATPGQDINVTINAVDANFHIINGVGDTIAITSDDGTAFLPVPTAMVNGTLQEVVNLDTDGSNPGTHHVTATDQSNAIILPNTSSGVLVQ